jgi:hypothetical protein
VTWTTTVQEITAAFRQARNIPVEKDIKLRMPEDYGYLEAEMLIFIDELPEQMQQLRVIVFGS